MLHAHVDALESFGSVGSGQTAAQCKGDALVTLDALLSDSLYLGAHILLN